MKTHMLLPILFVLFAVTLAAGSATVEFKKAVIYPVGPGPWFVLAADFNGDGKPDLAVVGANTSILLGNGDGTFRAARSLAVTGELAVGDFNGDHKADLLADDGYSLSLYLSKGDGTFQSGVRVGGSGSSLFAADFNLDGRLDVISGSKILLGNGDSTFQAPQDTGADTVVFVGDLNGDGKPDLLASSGVMLGNGDGTFQAPIAFPWPSCGMFCRAHLSNMVIGDFDGDGEVDLAVGWTEFNCIDGCTLMDTSIVYFYGNGDGTFRAVSSPASKDFLPYFLMAADFNGDGRVDLAVAPTVENGSSLIKFYLAGGDVVDYDIGSGPLYLIAADLNGDRFPDIVSANFTEAAISVCLNLPPDFTLNPTAASLVVKRGKQGTEKLTVGSQAGFSDAVALTCSISGPAPVPTCSLSPDSVLPGDTTQLTVNAGARSASAAPPERRPRVFLAALLPLGLVGCAFLSSLPKRRLKYACFLLMTALSAFTVGCGGGGGGSPQPVGQSYTITVTGISGAVQHSTTVQLTVN